MARAIATNARVGFNRRKPNSTHSGYQCPGSVVTWGPIADVIRDPRWGRSFEAPSEDPLLAG
eukprot:gene33434-37599_t